MGDENTEFNYSEESLSENVECDEETCECLGDADDETDCRQQPTDKKSLLHTLFSNVGLELFKEDTVATVSSLVAIISIIGFLYIHKKFIIVTCIAVIIYVVNDSHPNLNLNKVKNKLSKSNKSSVQSESSDDRQ